MRVSAELAHQAVSEWEAMQKEDELAELASRVADLEPKLVLEIGVFRASTFWLWDQITNDDTLILGIENNPAHMRWQDPTRTRLFVGDSHSEQALTWVQEQLGNREIDFLFIDGDHTYESVQQDWRDYSPLVRNGGLIALHDIIGDSPPHMEVGRFWSDLHVAGKEEIVGLSDLRWGGIGLVYIQESL